MFQNAVKQIRLLALISAKSEENGHYNDSSLLIIFDRSPEEKHLSERNCTRLQIVPRQEALCCVLGHTLLTFFSRGIFLFFPYF